MYLFKQLGKGGIVDGLKFIYNIYLIHSYNTKIAKNAVEMAKVVKLIKRY